MVQKESGLNRVIKTIGCVRSESEVLRLEDQARIELEERQKQCFLDFGPTKEES